MKRIAAILLVVCMAAALCACGSSASAPASGSAAGGENPVELVMANVTSQSAKDAGVKFAELVEKYSNGSVKVTIFADNVLGTDAAEWEMCQTGECDIAVGSTSSICTTFTDFYIFDIPYFFLNKNEVYTIGFNGEAAQEMKSDLEQLGLKGLAMWENGFRNLTTNDKEVKTVADLAGLKIRTMENPIHLAAWKALGANPTPMAFTELFTAMQQGTVDGEENPIGIITSNSFYEVEKYCMLTEHVYTPYYVVMNLGVYNSLSDAQREAVDKAMAEATQYQYEQSQKYEDEGASVMEANGCTVVTVSDKQKIEFKNAVMSADCMSLAKEKMANPGLVDTMNAELEAARG